MSKRKEVGLQLIVDISIQTVHEMKMSVGWMDGPYVSIANRNNS